MSHSSDPIIIPSTTSSIITVLSHELDKDILPNKTAVLKILLQEEAINSRMNTQEDTKIKLEREKTKQKLIDNLFHFLEKIIKYIFSSAVFVIIITVISVIGLVFVGVNSETTGDLTNFKDSVKNADLPNLIIGWIQIIIDIAQIIIPFFL